MMKTLPGITKKQKLDLELDIRLVSLWRLIEDIPEEEWDLNKVSHFIRAAYGLGYVDALTEDSSASLLVAAPGYRISGRKR